MAEQTTMTSAVNMESSSPRVTGGSAWVFRFSTRRRFGMTSSVWGQVNRSGVGQRQAESGDYNGILEVADDTERRADGVHNDEADHRSNAGRPIVKCAPFLCMIAATAHDHVGRQWGSDHRHSGSDPLAAR